MLMATESLCDERGRQDLEQERMLESLDTALAARRAYRAGFFTERQYEHLITELGIRNYIKEGGNAQGA